MPKPWPGCWGNKKFLRFYKRIWTRRRRLDAEFRRAEAKQLRSYRNLPGKKSSMHAKTRLWKREHPKKVQTYNHQYHARFRQRRCFFCNKAGKSGRGALKRIWRLVPDGNGRMTKTEIDYCGKC